MGVNLSPLNQWQNSHQLQGDEGVFSNLWAQCDISSTYSAVPALCFSFVSLIRQLLFNAQPCFVAVCLFYFYFVVLPSTPFLKNKTFAMMTK